jgi:hypothetical protein
MNLITQSRVRILASLCSAANGLHPRLLTSKMVDIYVGSESTHWPLHERLLTYHSPFFANVFYKEQEGSRNGSNKSYGLPDEDDFPFELLVGWLYSRAIRAPKEEKDIGPLLELYLLAEKFEMVKLANDVVDTVREFYHQTSTYPGLRRVQYIYAETNEDNIMREMMVNSIARQLTTSSKIPAHWVKALQRNGQLAVDIIRSIQLWHIDDASIPDARDTSSERGRKDVKDNLGFSEVVRQDDRGDSIGTTATMDTDDTNLGIESVNTASEASESKDRSENGVKGKEPEQAAE